MASAPSSLRATQLSWPSQKHPWKSQTFFWSFSYKGVLLGLAEVLQNPGPCRGMWHNYFDIPLSHSSCWWRDAHQGITERVSVLTCHPIPPNQPLSYTADRVHSGTTLPRKEFWSQLTELRAFSLNPAIPLPGINPEDTHPTILHRNSGKWL